jgi:Leu/Phe-tRNA-protein transferase
VDIYPPDCAGYGPRSCAVHLGDDGHGDGWAHGIEYGGAIPWSAARSGGAIGIGIGGVISGDSLFGRHQDAARVAVADTAARPEEARRLLGLG